MSAVKSFFDTNILLYMYSDADASKQRIARQVYRTEVTAGSLLLSTQVVQEFYAAATRKLAMPKTIARRLTESFLDLPLVVITTPIIRSAFENETTYKIAFWEALILAAAQSGGAGVVYTEDLNHGQQYGSVSACNPFRSCMPSWPKSIAHPWRQCASRLRR
jgi:predicted nucleic acid-binding protein